ncbi:16S rRNA (cytidine(1402)-2'-O)-methyltransferase [Serpentinicella alkaliphila]|uniref:Ribosomal RNA small subunit methyltransferase I n=1 Tax=Serpentinicella alkaliphila TaxID=1734049 RepID=A0A4R2U290_9FIRM|nr:16S rRNA (cytidine(1402)-2'-O)-methyltransferase [Serpentinicella alkaliphila]QUH25107.1 16S rRNA (cytidine(1402)-2'-O)-methyltransferase [Serpentinicella alkaliphila]TCQ01753.1 16S rRNA (cytidine1402-2'-O)-methyltransferase [Serpentinicella alkaliphila]
MSGKLYICPTPIGNLEDITLRTIRVLSEVDLIIAEDTRHTLKLLNHLQINKPLSSYHEHNEKTKGLVILEKLMDGNNVALVSDAGMPGISDPGEVLIKMCIENNIETVILPGSTAAIVALVGSGLSTERFAFEGFLGHHKKTRRERLEKIKYDDRTLIFYEAPHRIKQTLKDMEVVLGDRAITVAREITKKYEQFLRGSITNIIEYFEKHEPRGEFVIVCQGSSEENIENKDELANMSIKESLLYYIDLGFDKKEAIKKVMEKKKLPKKEVYKESIDL